MRLLVGAVVVSLLVAGCAEAKPAAVSGEFKDTVTKLLAVVAADVRPTFEAKTCGSVFDSDADSHVRMWANAKLPGTAVDALRAAAVAAGWQPQVNDSYELALLGPQGTQLGLTGDGTVRVERSNCSMAGRHSELDGDFNRPDLLPAQRGPVSESFAVAVRGARSVFETAGLSLEDTRFPASGRLEDAVEVSLSNCAVDSVQGAEWSTKVEKTVPEATDMADLRTRLTRTLRDQSWQAEPTDISGQRGWVRASQGGAKLSVFLDKTTATSGRTTATLELEIRPTRCVPVK